MADSPELAAAKRLLDAAKDRGFTFQRIAFGEDAPLRGIRESTSWLDEVYVGGLSSGCSAARRRRYSLIVPGGLPATERISGDALGEVGRRARFQRCAGPFLDGLLPNGA